MSRASIESNVVFAQVLCRWIILDWCRRSKRKVEREREKKDEVKKNKKNANWVARIPSTVLKEERAESNFSISFMFWHFG